MTKPLILILAAALGFATAGPASARAHHRARHVHDLARSGRGYPDVPTFGGRRDVLEASRSGNRLITGRIGLHRNHLSGDVVPDSDGPDLILSGRASRTGVSGANGLPGTGDF